MHAMTNSGLGAVLSGGRVCLNRHVLRSSTTIQVFTAVCCHGLKRAVSAASVFPSCRGFMFSCLSSPRAESTHSLLRARVYAGFPHRELFAKRAFNDGASPTSLVIRPNSADKWGLDSLRRCWCVHIRSGEAVRLGAGGRGSGVR